LREDERQVFTWQVKNETFENPLTIGFDCAII